MAILRSTPALVKFQPLFPLSVETWVGGDVALADRDGEALRQHGKTDRRLGRDGGRRAGTVRRTPGRECSRVAPS